MKRKLSPIMIFIAFVNLILFFIKFFIGIRTNSLCIYTDSVNNLMDTLSALLAAIGVFFLSRPKTENFPFGFGRLEYITGFIMSVIMTAAGLSFAYGSLERFFAPTPVWFSAKYAVIVGVTCLVKFAMGIVLSFKYKKDRSPVLKTVMMDSFLDCGITLAALVSFTLTNMTGILLDAFIGLAISIIIAVSGIKLIIFSLSPLIGRADSETEEIIREIILEADGNITVSDIKIHNYGIGRRIADIYLCGKTVESRSAVQKTIKNRLTEELGLQSAVEWEDII